MVAPRPQFDRDKISEFCHRHHIHRLAIFGSVLRDDFQIDSDVDVLVIIEPDTKTGLSFFTMQDELTSLIGHRVDLNTPGFLHPKFRDQIVQEAQDIYVAVSSEKYLKDRSFREPNILYTHRIL